MGKRIVGIVCIVGFVAACVVVFFATRYNVPVVDVYYEVQTVGQHDEYKDVPVRVEVKDYSDAPLWVEIGSEYSEAILVGSVFLLLAPAIYLLSSPQGR